MEYWIKFWEVLMTPSAHEGDPYSEASNQLGHIALGCIFSLIFCVVHFAIFGEMPVRLKTWVLVVAGYAFVFEFLIQGWKGQDSFVDTFFIQCGCTMTLWPVREVGISTRSVILEFHPVLLGILMAITFIVMLLHLKPRVVKYFKSEDRNNVA